MSLSSEEGIVSQVLKVRLFTHSVGQGLEEKVNSWLSTNKVAIRDIIYQHSMTTKKEAYSCMVIYT